MQTTVVPGISTWSRWQPDRAMFFNAWFAESASGNIVVDPLEPDADDLAFCDARGVAAVVVTNRDHERAAGIFSQRYGAPVVASSADAAEMSVPVARTVGDGDDVFGWRVVLLDGFKTAGEFALVRDRIAITGDALWGVPAGALRLMPDEKLRDPVRAALSIRRLLEANVQHALVGDGMPVFHRAFDALTAMLDARTDVLARRINIADAPFVRRYAADAPPYRAHAVDVGRLLGATKLGYALHRLATGDAYCPAHWHTREEEMLLVWSGAPTLRTPAGTFALRAGDIVAFPTGPAGTHRLANESDEPCIALVLANADAGDVCFYPDSDKLMVVDGRTIVRSAPQLDYFDGEVPTA